MKRIILLFLSILIISCKTYDTIHLQRDLKKAMLIGKVITEDGLPLEEVIVKLNNLVETNTDINGRFLFNFISFGKYKIVFEREGYSPAEYDFVYNFKNRRVPFVKAKMFSMNYLVNEGFELLKEKKFNEVEKVLKKLDKINQNEEVVLYLKAMRFYVMKKYNESLPILEGLKKRDRENIYYQLTLIDVYKNLDLYEDEINLCLYIGRNNKKEYYKYIKKAAEIYKDKLNNMEKYEELIKEYNKLYREALEK